MTPEQAKKILDNMYGDWRTEEEREALEIAITLLNDTSVKRKCRWLENWNAQGKRWKCSVCGGFIKEEPINYKCCPLCTAEVEVTK